MPDKKQPPRKPRGVPDTPRFQGDGETVSFSIRLDRGDWEAFRDLAAERGESMNGLVNGMIKKLLKARPPRS